MTYHNIDIPHYYRTMVALDIERSTVSTNPEKAANRQTMYEIFEAALIASGIQKPDRVLVNCGDGVLTLIRPMDRAPKINLLRVTVPTIETLLEQHNTERDNQIRLRVAIHAGEVHRDNHGWYGEAIDVIFRLLNSPEARLALSGGEKSIALIVSGEIQHTIIRHKYPGIDPADFHELFSVNVHDTKYHGWLHHTCGETWSRIESAGADLVGR